MIAGSMIFFFSFLFFSISPGCTVPYDRSAYIRFLLKLEGLLCL